MSESMKQEKKKRPDVKRVVTYLTLDQFIWLKALASELSLKTGRWVKRPEVWSTLVERCRKETGGRIAPIFRGPFGAQSVVVMLDPATESAVNALETEFEKSHPTLPVSDSLFLRSLVAHFTQQETPHVCAERCLESLPAPRRDA